MCMCGGCLLCCCSTCLSDVCLNSIFMRPEDGRSSKEADALPIGTGKHVLSALLGGNCKFPPANPHRQRLLVAMKTQSARSRRPKVWPKQSQLRRGRLPRRARRSSRRQDLQNLHPSCARASMTSSVLALV